MKKMIMFALLGLLFVGGPSAAFAQGEDSTDVSLDAPKDTISIDKMDPTFYEEETPKETPNNTMTYALVGGIVVVAGAAYYFIKKKKQ